MGRAKEAWMEQQEELAYEEKQEWIQERLDDCEADESTSGWYAAEIEYEEYISQRHLDLESEMYDEYYNNDYWDIIGKTKYEIFIEIIENSLIILHSSLSMNEKVKRNLFVMLYGHIVASIEAYLSSLFTEMILENDILLKRLVENDPIFAQQKFTIKEIYTKQAELKNDVKKYLNDLIFHDIKKVKPLYKSVLNVDFGSDLQWLFNAVSLRHHCVHRAGYDKEGNDIDLNVESIETLIQKGTDLINLIETEKDNLLNIKL